MCYFPIFLHQLHSLSDSEALKTVINLFHQQFQVVITEGKVEESVLTSILSALNHIDPLRVAGNRELLSVSWIAEILNSGYQGYERCLMAGKALQLLGKRLIPPFNSRPTWIPSILRFLSLCEECTLSPSSPRLIALNILSTSEISADFGVMILPILTSTLRSTHPLQARHLALITFLKPMTTWFSSQMEDIPSNDLDKLLRAVGDPFQLPDPPLLDGEPLGAGYDPNMAAVVLIEFASSDIWRDHLRRPNLASYEAILSTSEGKRAALGSMLDVVRDKWPEFLRTATKIAMAIRRLEELQCMNMVEVVIMWAWTIGVVNPVDVAWTLIGHETLRFYQTRGMSRLIALKQHVAGWPNESHHAAYLIVRCGKLPCRAGSALERLRSRDWYFTDFYIAQACQLRRLYHLFGYDLTTWKEAVVAEGVEEETDLASGPCAAIAPSLYCGSRDYPYHVQFS